MASWKKVIVSGSSAALSSLTLDTALPVAQGGIGASSLTDKAVLISQDSGTDAVGALALTTNGSIVVGGTNGPAVEAASDVAGTGLTATTGDGTLVINVDAAQTQITDVGTLDTGAISSGFGNIDNGTSTLNTGNATVDTLINDSAVASSHITGSFTGSFIGDGSGLTGTGLDVDGLSNYGAQTIAQTDDHFLISDDGTEKKITFSDLEDSIFANISGDATVAGGGALTIASDSVSNSMLENMTRGTIKVGGTSNAPTDLDAKTDGQILVGDGTDIASVAVSGDISLASNGAVTIAATSVENSMLAGSIANSKLSNSTISGVALGSNLNDLTVDDTTIELNSGTTFNGSAARTISAKTAAIADGGGALATADQIHTFYTAGGADLATALNTDLGGDFTIGNQSSDTATFSGAVMVEGNLTIKGTQTSQNVTNLLVEDKFILLNSGSAAGDGGIVVQTHSGYSGSALFYDDSASRWGLTKADDTAQSATSATPRQYIVSVSGSTEPPVVGSNPQDFGGAAGNRIGMMHIETDTGDIYIWS
tara:strand:- start:242 stop:1858 length:1617 start_codon:yes stop_codon:yes gene_type:complete